MSKLYNVGAYVRLSMEGASYDSESVDNQISMLSKFIDMMPGWVEHKFYVDDGYSGASFQRPAFLEMMGDIRCGKVNLLLVKDLSRFGRNYLEAGRYLEEELPSLGCRFVSLSENIDTENGENDIVPFLNAMNDWYVKNHSDRIRSIMAAKAKDGQKISGHAPYGFRRSDEDNTRLVIDGYSAGIVRRIFEMRANGVGFYTIAKTLNDEDVVSPMVYYLRSVGRDEAYAKARYWKPSYLNKMTKNELYIGNAVQLMKKVVSYRDKREVFRPADEHIRIDGAFPAIISMDLWEAVQVANRKGAEWVRNKKPPEKCLFSDVLVCADCGAKLVSIRKSQTGKKHGTEYVSYLCGKFHASAGAECSRHSVSQHTLGLLVFDRLRQMIDAVKLNEKAMVEKLTSQLVGDRKASKAQRKKEAALLRQRIHKLEVAIERLYEERVTGQLSDADFTKRIQESEAERLDCEQRFAFLETSDKEADEKVGDIQKWIRLVKQNAAVNEIDRDLLLSLIDKIEIGEGRTVNGVRERDLRIHYKFIGSLLTDADRGGEAR
jgi:DNA invertase Pin-like site-specific DNA recombinase